MHECWLTFLLDDRRAARDRRPQGRSRLGARASRPSGRLGRLCTALPTATGPPRHCHVRPHFTVVLIVAVLLAGLGSCVLDVTVEVSTTVALPVATRTIVTVAVAPL